MSSKKTLTKGLVFLLALVVATGCFTISHRYGPYSGRVVDAQTGAPIAGAAVLVRFETDKYESGEIVSRYADAVETITGADGAFNLPAKRVIALRFLSQWASEGKTVIFSPGYGCFPKFPGARIKESTGSVLKAGEQVTLLLPALSGPKDRKENLSYIYTPGVPEDKMPHLSRLKKMEIEALRAQ